MSTSATLEPVPEDEVSREAPSVPTGVGIDQAKVLEWHNDMVRFTDNFPIEKLDRIYTSMAKVSDEFLICFIT